MAGFAIHFPKSEGTLSLKKGQCPNPLTVVVAVAQTRLGSSPGMFITLLTIVYSAWNKMETMQSTSYLCSHLDTPSIGLGSSLSVPAYSVPMIRVPALGRAPKPSAHPLLACALCLCAAYYPPSAGYLGANPKVSPGSRGQTIVTNGWQKKGYRR